ncbi:hypothetical protein [Vibrio sp. 99-8-1]|uniref:hypothetical protein n=1 Tax=Vibrio sp. 99-8-1 TaxID=2607602 RepID=UPI001493A69A|nr:hypothetical protein [Vibrio sp. 99-8-1]
MKTLTEDQVELVSGGVELVSGSFILNIIFFTTGYISLLTMLTAGIGSAAIIWSNQK